MSNDNKLTIISAIADRAILTAEPVMAYKFGRNVPAILISIRDGVNSEASFAYLDMAQAGQVGERLIEMSKAAKLTPKV